MSIKSILLPLSGVESDLVTARAALLVARNFGSQIYAVFAREQSALGDSFMLAGMEETAYHDVLESAKERAEKREIEVRRNFGEILALVRAEDGDGVTAVLEVVDGSGKDAIIERGGVYDMLVVARPEGGAKSSSQETAETSLFHTGRPVLLAPVEAPRSIGRKVLVAWNKSPQAGRALAAGMPFLEQAEETLIFHVDTGAKSGPAPGRLRQYLALHGVNAEVAEIEPDYRPVGEQVLDQAHEFGADLIVMGAYSQSRMRERLL
ncbi:MAG: universal stress protein, partial [Alphaproteobacteria bacterium]